ncbi:MAG: hypothetical protein M3154_01355, partial [Candidatus Eremiobacteraeota bacterium]|nr:hypothetical protein [Candidatus Eremiobacteraeota bacterium]
YRPVNQDAELIEAFVSAIKVLAHAAGMARAHPNDEGTEGRRAAREALLGYAILAVGEARSFVLLLSDGLDKHARIHMRAIYEYEFRVRTLLNDDSLAPAFMRSFAYEARAMGRDLGTDAEKIDAEIARALNRHPDDIESGKESAALFGGTMKKAMDDESAGTKRYAVTFRWASQISHGLIMGLREMEKSVHGADRDVFERAARAPNTETVLYVLIWPLLHLTVLLQREFGVDVEREVSRAIVDAERVNDRLRFVSHEHFVSGLADIGITAADGGTNPSP